MPPTPFWTRGRRLPVDRVADLQYACAMLMAFPQLSPLIVTGSVFAELPIPEVHVLNMEFLFENFGLFLFAHYSLLLAVLLAAYLTRRRRHYNLCLIIYCAECLIVPMGPPVGLYSLWRLTRPESIVEFHVADQDAEF